eukprot:TRINITY_DN11938_c6_g7_i5.p1 TRINITY_DN11938_c6_g7~~TRINITY_DN11938_c6_g7_i5.p1  ORF type:complete len:296 (+),score=61.07 TRINITY_DN11938_c6_g7_i5:173-1060(+)
MALAKLSIVSNAEAQYILDGVATNIRTDGRVRSAIRAFEVESNIVSNASGSCRVRRWGTEVLAGVKVEAAEPTGREGDEGSIEFGVQFAAAAAPMFTSRELMAYSQRLVALLKLLVDVKGALDLKKLCIIEGETAFALKVDVMILQVAGGGLHDAVATAVFGALQSTDVPAFAVLKDGDGAPVDWELTNEPASKLDCSQLPLSVTVRYVNDYPILDATLSEEACSTAATHVAVDQAGNICGSLLEGGSSGIDPALLSEGMALVQTAGKQLISSVTEVIARSRTSETAPGNTGFLR